MAFKTFSHESSGGPAQAHRASPRALGGGGPGECIICDGKVERARCFRAAQIINRSATCQRQRGIAYMFHPRMIGRGGTQSAARA